MRQEELFPRVPWTMTAATSGRRLGAMQWVGRSPLRASLQHSYLRTPCTSPPVPELACFFSCAGPRGVYPICCYIDGIGTTGNLSVDSAWEHEPTPSSRETTASACLLPTRVLSANLASWRRLLQTRCTCPHPIRPKTYNDLLG